MSVATDVKSKYPNLYFLLQNPEIGPLLRQAVDPNSAFSPESFYARLTNTHWWKSRSSAQREWEFQIHTDPGTARSRIDQYRSAIKQQASRLGVGLSGNQISILAVNALSKGWDPNSPEVGYQISQLRTSANTGPGAIRTLSRQAMATAQGQYMVPMTKGNAARWGDWIARGLKTEDDLKVELQRKAISRFPYLAEQIKAGETPQQIFAPHRDMIAQELEISPDSIDLMNSRWSKVTDVYDKSMGKHRPMTLYEVQTLARQDSRWWKTSKGKAADAGMADMILQKFGKRA